MILSAKNIFKTFSNGKNTLSVLNDLSIEILENDFITIMGPSGIGKSTFLNILSTLDRPDSGLILFDGKNLSTMNSNELSNIRLHLIGFIFQFHHLIPEFNILDNVTLPNLIANKKPDFFKAKELLDYVGIIEKINNYPSQLSGGEKARVAVARSLMNNPKIIFADEPTGNLDLENAEILMNLFKKVKKDFFQSIVIATHNPEVAKLGNKKFFMLKNKLKTIDNI